MLSVALQLRRFHSLGIVFYGLNSSNIYVDDQFGVFFIDWTFARSTKFLEINNRELFADCDWVPQFAQRGEIRPSVDIFSLGKVFGEMLKVLGRSLNELLRAKVESLVLKMTA